MSFADFCSEFHSGLVISRAVKDEMANSFMGGWDGLGTYAGLAVGGVKFVYFVEVVVKWEMATAKLENGA